MLLSTLKYQRPSGWSRPFPAVDGERTLVLVFGATSFLDDPSPLTALRRHFANSHILGCSTAGEVFGGDVDDETLAVAVATFDRTRLRLATGRIDSAKQSRAVGERLGAGLAADDLRGVLVLSDGLLVNGTDLVRGVESAIAADVPITGGLAGDGSRFERTWVLAGQDPPTGGIVTAVGFYGDAVRVAHGSRGGWDMFGPERIVTRAEGNVLYELDGRAALSLYKDYLGDRAAGLPATGLLFPLAIRATGDSDKVLVRTILGVDEATQSMTFAGDVPQGWHARLMKANFDRLVDGAAAAAVATRTTDDNAESTLAIAVSCVGRRLVLGERTEEELEATLDGLPRAAEMVGFYSYGEISPTASGTCELHNQTMTLTTIQERA